jgi:hypothetical protein
MAVAISDHTPWGIGDHNRSLTLFPAPILIKDVVHNLNLYQLNHKQDHKTK